MEKQEIESAKAKTLTVLITMVFPVIAVLYTFLNWEKIPEDQKWIYFAVILFACGIFILFTAISISSKKTTEQYKFMGP